MKKRFSISERIRWSDMDTAGIMYFGKYTRLFEIAETEMLREGGVQYNDETFARWQAYPLRVSFHADFHAPILLDDLVRIELWTSKLGNASFTLAFSVHRDRDNCILGEGYCSIVTVGKESGKAVGLPQELRRALAATA